MRKSILCTALAAAGVIAGCSGNGSGYKIIATSQDAFAQGDTILLIDYDTDERIDSVVVADSTLVFEGNADKERIVTLTNHGKRLAVFLLEPGETTVDLKLRTAKGTPLNDKNQALNIAGDSIIKGYYASVENLKKSGKTEEEMQDELDSLTYATDSVLTALNKKAFEENKDNAFGLLAFLDYAYGLDKAQLESALNGTPEWFRNSVRVKRFIDAADKLDKTAPGKMFTDFTVATSDGKEVKLSDYVGKGDYVLVDFWASWCGPCMREMPGLKEIYNKYNGKGLQIVGVAVWDNPDDTRNAVVAQQLPWTIIDNAQRIPTDLYGIMGIPHIIMFAPDGTIAFRGLTGEELHKAVVELMEKQ